MSHTRGNRSDYLPCLVQLVVGLLQLHGVLVSQLLHNSLVAVRLFVHLPLQLRHFLFTLPTKFLRRGCCVQRIFQLALQSLQLLTDYRRATVTGHHPLSAIVIAATVEVYLLQPCNVVKLLLQNCCVGIIHKPKSTGWPKKVRHFQIIKKSY